MLTRLLNFERPTWYRHLNVRAPRGLQTLPQVRLYLSFLALFGCDTSDKDAPLEIETAKVATEPTSEEKMQANAISYKFLVLERGLASCENDIPIETMRAPCKEAVVECTAKAELAFRRGEDAAEGSLRLAAQEYEACYFPTVTAKIAALDPPTQY